MKIETLFSAVLLAAMGTVCCAASSTNAAPTPAPDPVGALLLKACADGNDNLVSVFLSEGASITAVDREGFTPLMKAAISSHPLIVKKLLALKAPVDTANKYGETALNIAAWNGDADSVQQLCRAGADVKTQSQSGSMPLMGAAYRGDLAIIGVLLDYHAPVNARSFKGTALTLAAQGDKLDALKLLLDRGADPNVYGLTRTEDHEKMTPLAYAAEHGNVAAIDLLLQHGAKANEGQGGFTPMIAAAEAGSVPIMETLKAHGAQINSQDEHGTNALIGAAGWNRLDVLKKLVEWKADLNLKDKEGRTALVNALTYGSADAALFLIAEGADVNAKDNRGESALSYAQNRGLAEVVAALKTRGATPVELHVIPFPTPAHPLTPARAWALALAAPYMQHDGNTTLELLGHGSATDGAIRMLKSSWNVTDHDTLLAQLHQLATEGHRSTFQKMGRTLAEMSDADFEKELEKHMADPEKLASARAMRASYQKWKDRSGLAFDLCRYADLVDNGFCAHYLTEEEAWNLLLPMAKKVQESFTSWQELGDNLLDGRAIWAGDRDPSFDLIISLLRNAQDVNSPWHKPWNTDLGTTVDTDTSMSQ